ERGDRRGERGGVGSVLQKLAPVFALHYVFSLFLIERSVCRHHAAGVKHVSPGQRPGESTIRSEIPSPERAAPVAPFQGLIRYVRTRYPGRCPGLACVTPAASGPCVDLLNGFYSSGKPHSAKSVVCTFRSCW